MKHRGGMRVIGKRSIGSLAGRGREGEGAGRQVGAEGVGGANGEQKNFLSSWKWLHLHCRYLLSCIRTQLHLNSHP